MKQESGRSFYFQTLYVISFVLFFSAVVFSQNSLAGECKVKEPAPETIADAIKMATLFHVQIPILEKEYREKTGKELKVILVARAGQDMKDLLTLRDTDQRGQLIPLSEMIRYGDSESMNYAGEGSAGPDYNKAKMAIKKAYGDKARQSIYSHIGMMFKNHPEGYDAEDGTQNWMFRHMLRPCITADQVKKGVDPNKPELYDEDIFRFFTDDPWELRAQILVPSPEIQDNLEKLVLPKYVMKNGKKVADNSIPKSFNGKFYNAAASWKNTTEANSNQWVIELVAAATQPYGRVRTRAEAQSVLAKLGYRPMRALMSGVQAMAGLPFASKFAPYVRLHTDEQPYYMNYSIGELITTLSLEEWLKRNHWVELEKMLYIADKTPATPASKKKKAEDQTPWAAGYGG